MSFFKKLFGKKSTPNTSSPKNEVPPFDEEAFFTPQTEDINGNFLIHSFISEVPTRGPEESLTCRSFLTEGMGKVGQEELILTIALPENKNDYQYLALPYVGGLFNTIFHYAQKGVVVSEGEYTSLGENVNILGFRGIAYAQNPEKVNEKVPDKCLSIVLLHEREIQAVMRMGYMRILTMIGYENLRYPFPLWNTLDRPEIRMMEDMLSKSILSQPIVTLKSAQTHLFHGDDNKLIGQFSKKMNFDVAEAKEKIFPNGNLVIIPGFDPQATLCRTWSTEAAISNVLDGVKDGKIPDPLKILGCMLVLLRSEEETKVISFEDGFGVFMSTELWDEFSDALVQKTDFSFEVEEGTPGDLTGFMINWKD